MVECLKCGGDLGDHTARAASISLEVMGNEHTHSYWFCRNCDVYTRLWWVDNFLGPEETMSPGTVGREEGDRIVELIRKCPNPDWKRCECEAHRKLV